MAVMPQQIEEIAGLVRGEADQMWAQATELNSLVAEMDGVGALKADAVERTRRAERVACELDLLARSIDHAADRITHRYAQAADRAGIGIAVAVVVAAGLGFALASRRAS